MRVGGNEGQGDKVQGERGLGGERGAGGTRARGTRARGTRADRECSIDPMVVCLTSRGSCMLSNTASC